MTIDNRSEIVLLYDARDTNPNGDPLGADNPPRVDTQTNQAIVTDVRLKRYIRDELFEQGENIFVKAPTQIYDSFDSGAPSRDDLVKDVFTELDVEDMSPEEAFNQFLNEVRDVRYFGATFSVDDDDLKDKLPSSITGPVQFGHGRSLNPVSLNTESSQLLTVVASGEGKGQGTFAADNRLHYALLSFSGVVNHRAADYANLTEDDVERLDEVIWSSLLNQTTTRSKMGQQPRFYARIEYEENTQLFAGNSHDSFNMESEKSLDAVRSPNEYTVDMTQMVSKLEAVSEDVSHIVLKVDPQMTFTVSGTTYSGDELEEALPVEVRFK